MGPTPTGARGRGAPDRIRLGQKNLAEKRGGSIILWRLARRPCGPIFVPQSRMEKCPVVFLRSIIVSGPTVPFSGLGPDVSRLAGSLSRCSPWRPSSRPGRFGAGTRNPRRPGPTSRAV